MKCSHQIQNFMQTMWMKVVLVLKGLLRRRKRTTRKTNEWDKWSLLFLSLSFSFWFYFSFGKETEASWDFRHDYCNAWETIWISMQICICHQRCFIRCCGCCSHRVLCCAVCDATQLPAGWRFSSRLLAHLALPKWRHRKFINSSCNAMQKTRRCDPHKTRFGANTIVYSVTALMHLWYAFGSARICGSSDWHLAHMSTWATVVRLFGRVPWWVRSCSKFRLFANEMCFLAKLLIFTEGCSCWRTFTLFLSLSLSHTIEPPILQWFYIGPKLWSHAFGLFWHLNNADGTYDRLLCMPNSSHSHIEASNALVCRYVPLAYSTLCHPLWL